MIYAKVDVDLRDHPKAHDAGEAMATWLWGLLYTKAQQLDGLVPVRALLRGCWVGEAAAMAHADRLVAVGLWVVEGDSWRMVNYAAKNETAADVAARREETRKRVESFRSRRPSSPKTHTQDPVTEDCNALQAPVTPALVTDLPAPFVPGSGSGSGSGSTLRESKTAREASPTSTDPPPGWFADVVGMLEMNCGVKLRLADAWIAYAAHRESKGERPAPAHARYWLSSWWVDKVREEDRKAQEARARGSNRYPQGPPERPKLTPEQERAEAKSLLDKVKAARLQQKGGVNGANQ